jgi:5-methylcytosine-specific restriction endonuclease McrA
MGCIPSIIAPDQSTTQPHEEKLSGDIKDKGQSAYKKKAIPKRTRDLVWLEYNGRVYDAKCYCCDQMIDVTKFEAGHIKSERSGGETTIRNLAPVCGPCNKSMGTENMIQFATRQGYRGRVVGLNVNKIHLNILK